MRNRRRTSLSIVLATMAALVTVSGQAQSRADMAPVNDLPNPYELVDDHFMIPIADMPRAGEPSNRPVK